MQRRHFLVCTVNNEYKLRELEPALAAGLERFGALAGRYFSVESIHWTFYFINTEVTREEADTIAAELTQKFLSQQNH